MFVTSDERDLQNVFEKYVGVCWKDLGEGSTSLWRRKNDVSKTVSFKEIKTLLKIAVLTLFGIVTLSGLSTIRSQFHLTLPELMVLHWKRTLSHDQIQVFNFKNWNYLLKFWLQHVWIHIHNSSKVKFMCAKIRAWYFEPVPRDEFDLFFSSLVPQKHTVIVNTPERNYINPPTPILKFPEPNIRTMSKPW